MLQALTSAVNEAKPSSKSLRTTVPEGVVVYLQIEAGNRLDWRMEVVKGEKIVIVTKSGET